MEKYRQVIHVEGKSIEDIFYLPCILSVGKFEGSVVYYGLSDPDDALTGFSLRVGDYLCEDQEGRWSVLKDKPE